MIVVSSSISIVNQEKLRSCEVTEGPLLIFLLVEAGTADELAWHVVLLKSG